MDIVEACERWSVWDCSPEVIETLRAYWEESNTPNSVMLYHGMSYPSRRSYSAGDTIIPLEEPNSWTTSEQVARMFADLIEENAERVMLCASPGSIAAAPLLSSKMETEDESICCCKGFRVIDINYDGQSPSGNPYVFLTVEAI